MIKFRYILCTLFDYLFNRNYFRFTWFLFEYFYIFICLKITEIILLQQTSVQFVLVHQIFRFRQPHNKSLWVIITYIHHEFMTFIILPLFYLLLFPPHTVRRASLLCFCTALLECANIFCLQLEKIRFKDENK